MWDERPGDWEVRRLSEITKRVTRRNDGLGHPIMTISAKRGFMLQSDKYSREMAGDSLVNYTLLKNGEFAYNKGNSLTAPQGCIFRLEQDTAVIPFVYYCFQIKEKLDYNYAYHAFRSGVLNRELARAINSGVRNDGLLNLSASDFFRCHIAIPPISEQRAIAELLTVVERASEVRIDVIESLRQTKFSVMRELLTRGVRRAKAPMKPLPGRWVLGRVAEGVTQIPADWKLVILAKVAKLESGHTPSREHPEYWGGDIPWLSLGDTDGLEVLEVDKTAECVSAKGIARSSARILPKDTVVFSRTATVGKATRLKRPMATSQDFANWICGPDLLSPYLVQVFRHMQREWLRLQEGSTHQTIYMPVFKKLQILLPPVAEQQRIADVGEAFDCRITAEREALAVLTQNRAALAQELLSGRIRLPQAMIDRHRASSAKAA